MEERDPLRHPMELYRHIAERLGRGEGMCLATVISCSGSGPREAGASMAVSQDGKTAGTVGGGLLEAWTLETARTAIRDRRSFCQTFSLDQRQASDDGMLCGGRVEILVQPLDGGDPVHQGVFTALLGNGKKGRPCFLIRSIRAAGDNGAVEAGLGLWAEEAGLEIGSLPGEDPDIRILERACRGREPVLASRGETRYFIQPIDIPETVFIFGAGHVGREVATVCPWAGFRTVVIDDRRDFANAERFPSADEIIVDAFEACFSKLHVDDSAYIVIVTRGHAHDQAVLSRALRTPARYIGMIASRRKRDIIFRSLRDEGYSARQLAGVYSPVGLDIGARTPAEIAVSIAAEMIAVRARGERRRP